jgi:hypothetical protein
LDTVHYEALPIHFEINTGQTDEQVRFLSRGAGYTLFLTDAEAVFALNPFHAMPKATAHSKVEAATARDVVRMKFIGANAASRIRGIGETPAKSNYFIGNDPRKWRTASLYQKVSQDNLYPGVDLLYHGTQGELEYDFIVYPGANPAAIRFGFDGVDQIEIDPGGDLILRLGDRSIRQHAPVIYQEYEGVRRGISGGYVLDADNREVSFHIASYDQTRALVIDPVLSYSTYFGGSGYDTGLDIKATADSIYLVGYTSSTDFPTARPLQRTSHGAFDVFVTRLNREGSQLIYSTYLGGSGNDYGYCIAVDRSGSAVLTGITGSMDFPTAHPLQSNLRGPTDVFVTKLNPAGSELVYSTYLGGTGYDYGFGCVLDPSGNALLTGYTGSFDFPVVRPLQPLPGGGGDAFVAKINATGSELLYSTYLGGVSQDAGVGIAVDPTGDAVLTGYTDSINFPVARALQPKFGGGLYDAFLTRIQQDGSSLVYSTYIGGAADDIASSVAIDRSGNVTVTGSTMSLNFPTFRPLQRSNAGYWDAFVLKTNAVASRLLYSTYLGGSLDDYGMGVAVDSAGNAYIVGSTGSINFLTVGAFQPIPGGGWDAFVTSIESEGSKFIYSSYLGGSGEDSGLMIATDRSTQLVTGMTNSTNFPTVRPIQPNFSGVFDAFISRISRSRDRESEDGDSDSDGKDSN